MKTKIMSGFFIISLFLMVFSVSFVVANDDMQDQDLNYAENTADDTKSLEEFEEPQEPSWEYESDNKQNEADKKGAYQQEEMQEYKPEENVDEYNYDDNFNEEEAPEKDVDKSQND